MCKKCAQKCANFCVIFFFFLCKICAHFLHISNLHSVYTPREDTVGYHLHINECTYWKIASKDQVRL